MISLIKIPVVLVVITMSISSNAQVGHWKLNNDATDASGNNINGSLTGGPTFSTESKEGSHSIVLNGSQYVNLGNPTQLPSGSAPRTICAWAKSSTTASGDRAIVSYGTNSSSQAFYLAQSGTSLVAGGWSNNISVANFWTVNTWRHICMTYDGQTAGLYADGQLINTTGKTWNTTLLRAYIGQHVNNNNRWIGNIDDVRIYNRVLTSEEILALVNTTPQVPAAPTNFAATAISSSQINLAWTDNSTDETGFQIERSETSATSGFSVIHTTAINVTSFNNTGLTAGKLYYYRISARNGSILSTYASASATTFSAALIAPSGLVVSTASAGSLTLSWTDNSNNETGFEVERSTELNGTYSLISTTGSNTTTYTDPGLPPSTTYFYRIRAINGTGNSSYTPPGFGTTSGAGPTNLGGHWRLNNNANDDSGNGINGTLAGSPVFSTDKKEGTHSVSLNGTAQYIDLGNPQSFPSAKTPRTISAWAKTNTLTGAGVIFSFGTASNGQAFYIGMNNDAVLGGAWGSSVSVTGFWQVGVWRHICLTYDGITARLYADGTEITSAGRNWNLVLSRAYIGRHVNNNNHWNGSIDDVRVYNKALTASEVQALVSTGNPPVNVTGIAEDAASITLQWTDNSNNETGFEIERKPEGGAFTPVFTTAANAQHFTDGGLTANTNYIYRIRTVSSDSNSPWVEINPIRTMTTMQGTLTNFAFQYKYDSRKRMIARKVPGSDWVYMVYDNRDRLVFTQDGIQRNKKNATGAPAPEWSFTKYDEFNRPIMTGTYRHNAILSQEEMTSMISTSVLYETRTNIEADHGYTKNVLATNFLQNNFEVLSVTYYDDDSYKSLILNNGITDARFNYNACELTNQYFYSGSTCSNKISFPRLKGMVAATKTRILNESTYLWAVNHYDDKGRIVQSVTTNALAGVDRITNIFDFAGKLMQTKTTHNLGQSNQRVVLRKFHYDHMGRLLKTWHSLNGGTSYVLLSSNDYNELGQVVTKQIHNTDSESTPDSQRQFKQKIDYAYNIRGWLNSINDPGTIETSDLFGMNLRYHVPTISGITPQYNGNISQIDWRGPDKEGNQYGYIYDKMNRLKEAKYVNLSNSTKNARFNEKITGYDLNGNILALQRSGKNGINSLGITTYGAMDNLTYTYRGNQLFKVNDAVTVAEGFRDGGNSDYDYRYDVNGNMQVDKNKNIDGANTGAGNSLITYNLLNLPETVTKNNGEYIRYVYDAAGRKLRKEVYTVSNQLTKKSVYAGEFFYEGENPEPLLKFINTEEGRVITNDSNPEYQYHMKDHLGNVRVTFTTKEETQTVTATLEPARVQVEQSNFLRIENARLVQYFAFDRTNGSKPTTTTGYAQRLSGRANEKYGLARSISVMAGDKISAEVYAKYVDPVSTNRSADLNAFLTNVAGLIASGTTGSGTVVDGGSFSSSTTSFQFGTQASQITSGSTGTGPKAYLNWLVFDRDYNFLVTKSGFKRLSADPKETGVGTGYDVAHEKLTSGEISIDQPGYVYIFISNEETTPVDVYFDDFTVTQNLSPVVQTDDYYPFGLTFNSYRRENSVAQDFKYNGKELQDELDLGWLDYGARMYQPEIGRWNAIDRMSDAYASFCPYSYVLGNPISNKDVNGEWTVSRHNKWTLEALSDVGIGGNQAKLIAHYASVYADNPGIHIIANNAVQMHSKDMVGYRPYGTMNGIDYSRTMASQVTEWAPGSAGYNYNIWHSMRSKQEKEAYDKGEKGGISAEGAMLRGMEFGWGAIFDAAQSGTKLNDLQKNSCEIQSVGQGIHALQDAYAHKGRHDVGRSHIMNDMYGNPLDIAATKNITSSALNVYKLLTNDFAGIKTNKKGGLTLNVTGMSVQQKKLLLEKVNQYLDHKK